MARDFDFVRGMNFGMGFDSLRGNVRGNAVVSASGSAPKAPDTGQSVSFSLQRVETNDDYDAALSMSVDAAAVFGLFGGSGSFNLSQQRKFHSYSKYLVVSIRVINPLLQIPDPKLSASAFDLLDANRPDRFQQQFGDSFVLGISGGGLYYAVLEFTSTSQADLDNVSARLDAAEFGVFAAEAKFSSEIQKFSGQTRLQINSFQIGGAGEGAGQQVSIDQIIAKAQNFPAEALRNPRNVSVVIQDYFALDLPSHTPIQVDNARDVLSHYAKIKRALVEKLHDVEYIQLHPEQFVDPQSFDLAKFESNLQEALDALTANASECVEHIELCRFKTQSLPTLTLPSRKPVDLTTFIAIWTNTNRNPTDPNDRSGVIQRLEIFPNDLTHVSITAHFQFPNVPPDTAVGTYDPIKKAIEASVKDRGQFFTITNNLLIRISPQLRLQLVVINEEVIIPIAGNDPPTRIATTELTFEQV
jgi:hypothetical protein